MKPFLYALAEPDGTAFLDEACVACDRDCLAEQAEGSELRVVAVFTEGQVSDLNRRATEAEAMHAHNLDAIQRARDALLRIWPRGKDCEHVVAREAFAALGDA
jgi:hypothetical protein